MQRLTQGGDALLESYVSSEAPPEGALAEQFENEFMDTQTSLAAEDVLQMAPATAQIAPPDAGSMNYFYLRGHAVHELTAGDALDPNLATVVLAMTTPDGQPGTFNKNILTFLRVDAATGNAPITDHHPTFIELGQYARDRVPARFQVFQVPAGRYALWKFADVHTVATDFCFRTFAFDVQPGDVVYAGRWQLIPDHPLAVSASEADGARAALREMSADLSERMQVAGYSNACA